MLYGSLNHGWGILLTLKVKKVGKPFDPESQKTGECL